jgi:hypothetical protein
MVQSKQETGPDTSCAFLRDVDSSIEAAMRLEGALGDATVSGPERDSAIEGSYRLLTGCDGAHRMFIVSLLESADLPIAAALAGTAKLADRADPGNGEEVGNPIAGAATTSPTTPATDPENQNTHSGSRETVATTDTTGEEAADPAKKEEADPVPANLAKLVTNENWMAVLEAGLQLAPTYDETGQSSGFNEESLYLALRFDGRHSNRHGLFGWKSGPKIMRTGVDVTFRQAPIVNQSLETASSDMSEAGDGSPTDPPGFSTRLTGLTFNDVDDSVIVSGYISPQWLIGSSCGGARVATSGKPAAKKECTHFDGLLTSFGPFVGGGLSTRSDLLAVSNPMMPMEGMPTEFEDDSVVSYYGAGLRFDVEDFTVHGHTSARNGVRRAYIQAGRYKIEDYAGREDVWRWVIDAQYRLFTHLPIFVGLHANMSRSSENDTDDVALSLSYQFTTEDFLRRLTP